MPIDAGLVVQGLAVAFGISGIALSLFHILYSSKKMRLDIYSNAENIEGINQKLDATASEMENAVKKVEKVNKNSEKMLIQKIDTMSTNMGNAIAKMEKTYAEKTNMFMTATKTDIDKLNYNINKTHERFDRVSMSLIETQHTVKKNKKDNAKIIQKINGMQKKLSQIGKSKRQFERKIARLNKLKPWKKSNSQLKHRIKNSKGNTRRSGHTRMIKQRVAQNVSRSR